MSAVNTDKPENPTAAELSGISAQIQAAALQAGLALRLADKGHASAPAYLKAEKVLGHKLSFRNATVADADYIVALRTDEQKSRFISSTSADVEAQKQWLEKYAHDDRQIYFIIQDMAGEKIGTVRLYDQQADSFCWGSWIIQAGAASSSSIESALMVYHYALALGFQQAHFDVRKANESVWKFHERFGAKKTGETAEDLLYTIAASDIVHSLDRYAKFLPRGIQIQF
ncbi:GNAT family N-acetyltransferase [Undibacterium sp. Di27W]|uniref:GNAT family N-acetyltransferase n=1 Tax=Undibacterium sp. Di27W TaxID=3413036 RepID=UPI003BF1D505